MAFDFTQGWATFTLGQNERKVSLLGHIPSPKIRGMFESENKTYTI
jgi:hypothetical protein